MKLTINSAYGNFALTVSIALAIDDVKMSDTAVKLAKLGLTSEVYRLGNSAIDRAFTPKKAGKNGKLVFDTEGFKKRVGANGKEGREGIEYTEEHVAKVKEVLTKALSEGTEEEPGYAGVEVKVSEKVRGESSEGMKRARALVDMAIGAGTVKMLAATVGIVVESEDELDLEEVVAKLHAMMNPAK